MEAQDQSQKYTRNVSKTRSVTIVLVAGEASGDLLGSGLIKSLRIRFPYAKFVGIGGPQMQAQGLESWFSMETLSVMGITAVLKRLPQLLELRRNLVQKILATQPDVFIGIDSPDFNLGVAKQLRAGRIKTVHYVSPSVWAWRQGRVVGIAQSINLMLTLFPFEREFYLTHGVAATCVGHIAADEIPLVPSKNSYREVIRSRGDFAERLTPERQMIALLPGSRRGEVDYLMPEFLECAYWLHGHRPDLMFVVACANQERKEQIQSICDADPRTQQLSLYLMEGGARAVMGASDAVLLASGTATLEAMLLKKPMVVAYKWHWLTHWIISRMVKTPYIALPNILAKEALVPEFVQSAVNAENLGSALLDALNGSHWTSTLARFNSIHKTLTGGASDKAAQAVAELIES